MTTTHLHGLQRRAALLILAVGGALLLGVLVALLFVRSNHESAADAEQPLQIGHIHGIAATDDRVLIGAHYGVFAVAADGAVEPFGERRSDTMALAAVGDQLLASGHPSYDEPAAPANAGLLTSQDGAATWDVTALAGEADFHALDGAGDRTWGLDSVSGRLLTSTDLRTWQPVAELPLIDIAVDPISDDRVFGTTADGRLVRVSLNGDIEPLPTAPLAVLIAGTPTRDLVAIGPDGQLTQSSDAGATWQQQASVPGQPTALTVSEDAVYVATTDGFYRSDEPGQPFTRLFAITHSS